MKYILIAILILFTSCADKNAKPIFKDLSKTHLKKTTFTQLPQWNDENHTEALQNFINSCKAKKTRNLYKDLCVKSKNINNAKNFLEKEFTPYQIIAKTSKEIGLLTGYYEPKLHGSLVQSDTYKYPVYETPSDLITVNLSSIYPKLKHYRLRGRLVGNRLVPYLSRAQSQSNKHAKVVCYVDSKIDLFFLEIQGSGRVSLENGETLFLGFANQNGHKYRAIGRYLVEIGAINMKDVSLQSIRTWLDKNPQRVDEVLNYNKSVVYFEERKQSATGSLGLVLTPKRSIAVDRRYIPLGSMVYLSSSIDKKRVNKIVLAQDTGGAIKGAIRSDIFLGYSDEARESAGRLKSPLKLWILLPKNKKEDI